MSDREKVIKGLEIHIKPNSRCAECPYPNNGLCGDQLYHDALALLKEQDDMGKELTDAMELIHKKNERIKRLEEQIETLTKWRANAGAFD